MKKLLFLALITLFSNFAFSNEKVYISSDQVHIASEEILINMGGNLYSVSGVLRDTQGLHIMSHDLINAHTFSNTCPNGHYSPSGTGLCRSPGCDYEKK